MSEGKRERMSSHLILDAGVNAPCCGRGKHDGLEGRCEQSSARLQKGSSTPARHSLLHTLLPLLILRGPRIVRHKTWLSFPLSFSIKLNLQETLTPSLSRTSPRVTVNVILFSLIFASAYRTCLCIRMAIEACVLVTAPNQTYRGIADEQASQSSESKARSRGGSDILPRHRPVSARERYSSRLQPLFTTKLDACCWSQDKASTTLS